MVRTVDLQPESAHAVCHSARLRPTPILRNGHGWQRLREYLRGLPAAALIACWEDLVQADFRSVIPRIDRPTLLLYGGKSNFYRPEIGPWLAARIADCRLSMYDNADHSPHLTDPARFVSEVAGFAGS